MPADLPKTLLKLLIALLKHQARTWLGEEAIGIAAQTLLDEQLQTRLDAWLTQEETARRLLAAAEDARRWLQQARNCPDEDLRALFRDLPFGDLPAVQQALADLPRAMDSNAITESLRLDFERTLPNLTPDQHQLGAKLWTEALLIAVGSLEGYTLHVIRMTVMDLAHKLDAIGEEQSKIRHLIESLDRRSQLPVHIYSSIISEKTSQALFFLKIQEEQHTLPSEIIDKYRRKVLDRWFKDMFHEQSS
ncbi:MAG: hypothetical protein NZL98_02030 [Anaerolineales bacterium]|nr:hypothetical protein [Anaerolineales bacterium]